MLDLLDMQKYFILTHLGEGDIAVDFTMGNGNDTLFLSRTVGKSGHVYAFDIQEDAVASTRAHLVAEGAPENYTLIHDSHHKVAEYVKGPIKAGMFNLGYLPRSGRKTVTTMCETTLPARARGRCSPNILPRSTAVRYRCPACGSLIRPRRRFSLSPKTGDHYNKKEHTYRLLLACLLFFLL